MTQLEDETKRLAQATEESNQIISQIGPQLNQRLDKLEKATLESADKISTGLIETKNSINLLSSQIKSINDRNSAATWTSIAVVALQTLIIFFQLNLMSNSAKQDERYKTQQLSNESKQQKEQAENFKILNRPKLLNINPILNGNVRYGYIPLTNYGNLAALKVRATWKMVEISDRKVNTFYPKKDSEIKEENIQPTETLNIYFESEYQYEQKNIFLCVAFSYTGDGISKFQTITQYYLWDVEHKVWAPSAIIGDDHLRVLKDQMQDLKLRVEETIKA